MASFNEGLKQFDGSWGPKTKGRQNKTSDTVKATGPGKAGHSNEDGKGRSKGGMPGWGAGKSGKNSSKVFNPGINDEPKREKNSEASEQERLENPSNIVDGNGTDCSDASSKGSFRNNGMENRR